MLIKEAVRQRTMWRKGRIVDYIKGRDGKTRVVKLVTINSKLMLNLVGLYSSLYH